MVFIGPQQAVGHGAADQPLGIGIIFQLCAESLIQPGLGLGLAENFLKEGFRVSFPWEERCHGNASYDVNRNGCVQEHDTPAQKKTQPNKFRIISCEKAPGTIAVLGACCYNRTSHLNQTSHLLILTEKRFVRCPSTIPFI